MLGDARPVIIAPETDGRPSVVAPGQADVDLVAAVGPVLVVPQHARFRMNDQRQGVAMPERVDLRPIAGAIHERVVRRYGAIVAKTKDLAAQARGLLRDLGDVA